MKIIMRKLKSGIIFLVALAVMLIIVGTSYTNFKAIQNNVIEIEQAQLLSLATTVADSIERFFVYQSHNLEILAKNRNFLSNYSSYQKGISMDSTFQLLEDYYSIQSDTIELIRLIDLKGNEIYTYPMTDLSEGYKMDIEKVRTDSKYKVGKIYSELGQLYINILEPIEKDGQINAVLYTKVKLDNIYKMFIEPVKAGEKGYASVKDSSGTLIMHPNKEDIGENVIEARSGSYPDFDWSELEVLVEKQKKGESGVGIYHSLWFKDNDQQRVKKFSAYAPAQVGKDFWIVNISKDYLEVVSFLKERTYNIIIINFFIILIFVTTLLYLYRVKKDRALIAKEHELLLKVKTLNEELEEDIRQKTILEKELIKSKNKFENIFESGSDCIIVIRKDESAKIEEVNLKVTHSLGFTKEELLEKSYYEISGKVTPEMLVSIQNELMTKSSYIFEDCLMGNGRQIPVEINVKTMMNEERQQLVMISRDITMKKRFEAEMEENKRKEALMIYQSRLAAMGEMIGSIAHQWRQPLSGISMIFNNIEDAFEHQDLDEPFMKMQGKRIRELITYMSQTIDDFRFFFSPKTDTEDFLISKIMDQTLNFLKESIRLNNIQVHFDLKEDVLLNGRPNQLSQVLFAIIKNAIDALMMQAVENREIWIDLELHSNAITVKIEDSAGGIQAAYLDKIFDAYFTTKEAEKGTGLGLYIAKVIVEKNFEGTILAVNTDRGLSIVINLPI